MKCTTVVILTSTYTRQEKPSALHKSFVLVPRPYFFPKPKRIIWNRKGGKVKN